MAIKKIGLDVETKEKWLKQFYEKTGYKVIGKSHQQTWTQEDNKKRMITKIWHLEKNIR